MTLLSRFANMKPRGKAIVFLIVLLLVVSSIFVVFAVRNATTKGEKTESNAELISSAFQGLIVRNIEYNDLDQNNEVTDEALEASSKCVGNKLAGTISSRAVLEMNNALHLDYFFNTLADKDLENDSVLIEDAQWSCAAEATFPEITAGN